MNGNMITDYNPSALAGKRMEQGLNQRQLEEAIGAKQGEVALWEMGARGIPEDMLKRLAFMLRCETKDLMKGGKV